MLNQSGTFYLYLCHTPYLRAVKARTIEALEKALKEALELVTKEDAHGWFKSCGYPV